MKIDDKRIYDLATSLRGPDSRKLSLLKHIFTGRIRYYAGVNSSTAQVRAKPVSPKQFADLIELFCRLENSSPVSLGTALHFMDHIQLGILAIRENMPYREYRALFRLAIHLKHVFINWISCRTSSRHERAHERNLTELLSRIKDLENAERALQHGPGE